MSANVSELARNLRHRVKAAVRPSATHKFDVGAHVLHCIGARSERVSFQVTRQLPDGGAGLQYRIKGTRDGLERVVTESSLERGG
ncbi:MULTISPECIES: hypothetical protein [Methylosinus]|uniref:Uncharacterized protein n=1 Tax=Methylosinus trichosporium (strain ATCC 35070 / NCIMB 11131 / UNIQEM 75 / OB3b) TaxID=595536 RepID=A0A2D2D4B7_METT3|nr:MULTISPECIES: hypothetical protein [Methylosinus]ATQ69804.1 hypothetical protein CQW49_19375 [Methylosinus trichosporium OB3b]OBS52397.1 hypothetical protein A8B73_11090 [Methylosinus sp. 3S-1]